MTTVTSASNAAINGSAESDWINSSGDGVTISASSGDDYVISRGNNSHVFGGNDNDTLVILPSTGSVAAGGRGGTTGVTEVHGNSGADDIVIVHDNVEVYGDAGNDYITVKLYENAGDALLSLKNITLTGGDGRDTFAFYTELPPVMESLATVDGNRIEAVITDFSSTAHFCYDYGINYFIYSVVTDNTNHATDIVLTDNTNRLRVTLQGVTNIEDVVYSTAVKFVDDSVNSCYLGEIISNYTDEMSAIPAGISYDNYTVYVYDAYARNLWLMGTDEFNQSTSYRNIGARIVDARNSSRKRMIVGNLVNNVIYAGNGGDSIWGGAATNDTLYGGPSRDMFWYAVGDGNDCVRNFACGSDENSDVINFYDYGIINAYRDNGTIHFVMTSGEELIMPTEYDADTEIQYTTNASNINRAKIGDKYLSNVLTYDADINIFLGSSTGNTLKVEDSRRNMILLNGDYGQIFYDIDCVDASEATGNNYIYGQPNRNIEIKGGAGSSTLWGGAGNSNDTLISGTGDERFLFGASEGNDIIIGAGENDTIDLYNINLGELTEFDAQGTNMTVTFKNGEYSLKLENYSASTTFRLSDDSTWIYDKSVWTQTS